jgi:hypothetical protein
MRAPYRNRFDPEAEFIVRKPTTVSGRHFGRLERFDKTLVSERRLRQMFSQRTLVYDGEATPGGKLSAEQTAETFRGQRAALAKAVQDKRAKEKAAKLKKAAAEAAKAAGKGAKPPKDETAPKKPRAPRTPRAKAPPAPPAPRETVEGEDAVRIARAAVEIPEGWAELPWTDRLKLAAQLSDTPVRNGEEVAKEAELARRGNP